MIIWTRSVHIFFSGEAYVRSGEDPTLLMEEAMDRIDRSKPHYDNHFSKVGEYTRVARVLHGAGLDPRHTLLRAEEIMKRVGKAHSDPRAYEQLGVGFAFCGFPEDALRMIDAGSWRYIRAIDRFRYMRDSSRRIAREYLLQGDYHDNALYVANRFVKDDVFTAYVLARKAVIEGRQGRDTSYLINRTRGLLTDKEREYEEVYPLLGLALAFAGRVDEAEEVFRETMRGIEETCAWNIWDQIGAMFELAKAVNEAGYEAEGLFRRAFDLVEEQRIDWGDFCIPENMYQNGIRGLIECGRLDLAREFIDQRHHYGEKLLPLLALAKAEVQKGLSAEEIVRFPSGMRIAIEDGQDERAKEALDYLKPYQPVVINGRMIFVTRGINWGNPE